MTVILFEVSWITYGNTFHYTDKNRACKDNVEGVQTLWVIMTAEIVVGYVTYMILISVILGYIAIFSLRYSNNQRRNELFREHFNRMERRLPYLNAISNLKRKSFSHIREGQRHMYECIICMNEFKPRDQISELACDQRHYFHSTCLENWLKHKLECPLCKKSVVDERNEQLEDNIPGIP